MATIFAFGKSPAFAAGAPSRTSRQPASLSSPKPSEAPTPVYFENRSPGARGSRFFFEKRGGDPPVLIPPDGAGRGAGGRGFLRERAEPSPPFSIPPSGTSGCTRSTRAAKNSFQSWATTPFRVFRTSSRSYGRTVADVSLAPPWKARQKSSRDF